MGSQGRSSSLDQDDEDMDVSDMEDDDMSSDDSDMDSDPNIGRGGSSGSR